MIALGAALGVLILVALVVLHEVTVRASESRSDRAARARIEARYRGVRMGDAWQEINAVHRDLGLPALDPATGLFVAYETLYPAPRVPAPYAQPSALRFEWTPEIRAETLARMGLGAQMTLPFDT